MGYPDKLCDQVTDAEVDAYLTDNPKRVKVWWADCIVEACEALACGSSDNPWLCGQVSDAVLDANPTEDSKIQVACEITEQCEGHPAKLCARVTDAALNANLTENAKSQDACEVKPTIVDNFEGHTDKLCDPVFG